MINPQEKLKSYPVNPAQKSSSEYNSFGPIYNDYGDELFVAGQIVPPGTYLEVDSGIYLTLDRTGPLPASLNGRRAYYSRLERPWVEFQSSTRLDSTN